MLSSKRVVGMKIQDTRSQSHLGLRPGLLALILVLLAACGSGDAAPFAFTPVSLEEFPRGLGRGYPVAQVTGDGDRAAIGEEAPNFAFVMADGQGMELADLQGRPVVLNFWASWCGPCRLEMPELVELHEADPDLVVLAINVREELAVAEPFAEEFNMTMPVVLDKEGQLQRMYAVMGLPVTIFIDSDGILDSRWNGLLNAEILNDRVAALRE
jgi:cytochrome c biogenesis protein CcmG, thiol:disulfide interchange protein DsbE